MAFTIGGKLEGLGPVLRKLAGLKRAMRNKIVRRAVDKASQPMTKDAKARAPVDDGQTGAPGLYKKSVGRKVKTYRNAVLAFIGPRTGFKAVVRIRTRGKRKGQPVTQDPAKIGHLVEFGHGGPHPAPPHPHLRPAWDAGKAKAEDTLRREILEGIEREAANG